MDDQFTFAVQSDATIIIKRLVNFIHFCKKMMTIVMIMKMKF